MHGIPLIGSDHPQYIDPVIINHLELLNTANLSGWILIIHQPEASYNKALGWFPLTNPSFKWCRREVIMIHPNFCICICIVLSMVYIYHGLTSKSSVYSPVVSCHVRCWLNTVMVIQYIVSHSRDIQRIKKHNLPIIVGDIVKSIIMITISNL